MAPRLNFSRHMTEFKNREEAGIKHYAPKGDKHATPAEFLKNCIRKKDLADGDRDVVMNDDGVLSNTDDKHVASDIDPDSDKEKSHKVRYRKRVTKGSGKTIRSVGPPKEKKEKPEKVKKEKTIGGDKKKAIGGVKEKREVKLTAK